MARDPPCRFPWRIADFAPLSCRIHRRTAEGMRPQRQIPKQRIPPPCFPKTKTALLRGRTKTRLAGRPRQSGVFALPQSKHGVDCASISTTSDTEFLWPCPTTLLLATSSEEKLQRQSRSLAVEEV